MPRKRRRRRLKAIRKRLLKSPQNIPSRAKRPRIFLETSGVIYYRHGHSLMQAAVQHAIGTGLVEVSNVIRMEYLRGVVLNLVELYFLIRESDSVRDALVDWSQKVKQERKLKIVLMTIDQWLLDHDDSQNRDKSLRRLGDMIVRLVFEFDDIFAARATDRLRCQLGRVQFPRRTFSEDTLLQFYERFKAIQGNIPECSLCTFKTTQQRSLERRGIDLCSAERRQQFSANKGYTTQAERMEEALSTNETRPKCRWCERLGDTIIVLQAPKTAILVTADRAFEAFGQILSREIRFLPSLAVLKRSAEGPAGRPPFEGQVPL